MFTDPVSPDVDRGQYEDGAGPCLEDLREAKVVRVDDVRTVAGRWPRFGRDAEAAGVRSRAYWAVSDLAEGLRQAMASRAVIEQAKGKLMVQSGRTADEAFAMLVSASQRENVKLRDVARRIVEGVPHPV